MIFVGAFFGAIVLALQCIGTSLGVGFAAMKKGRRDEEMVNRTYAVADYYRMDDDAPCFGSFTPHTPTYRPDEVELLQLENIGTNLWEEDR